MTFLTFPIVQVGEFPGGLTCIHCGRWLNEGQPYVTVPTGMTADGDWWTEIRCVQCEVL